MRVSKGPPNFSAAGTFSPFVRLEAVLGVDLTSNLSYRDRETRLRMELLQCVNTNGPYKRAYHSEDREMSLNSR